MNMVTSLAAIGPSAKHMLFRAMGLGLALLMFALLPLGLAAQTQPE